MKVKQKLISTKYPLTINNKRTHVTNCVKAGICICTTSKKRFIKEIEERKDGGMDWKGDKRYEG